MLQSSNGRRGGLVLEGIVETQIATQNHGLYVACAQE